jgi:hypothetical protein
MKRLLIALVVVGMGQSGAYADPAPPAAQQVAAAQDLFARATTAYNLGRFDEAVTLFSKAYEAWPQPEFLYNIAQSHRLARNCKQALHFYKRFRSLKEQDTAAPLSQKKRDEIEKFIAELTECVANTERSAGTQPDTIVKPQLPAPAAAAAASGAAPAEVAGSPAGTGARGATAGAVHRAGGDEVTRTGPGPDDATGPVVVRFTGGIAVLSAADLGIPVQPVLRLTGGYPLHAGPATIELGAALSYSPLPYQVMDEQKLGAMFGARLAAVASYPVAPKLAVRGELGLGIVSLSGLVAGNPLSADRTAKSFTLPSLAVAVALDYAIARGFTATLSPLGLALSRGADGMYASSLRELDVVVGIGFRP